MSKLGHAMAQAVSCLSLTAEACVTPSGICGDQTGTVTFYYELFGFTLSMAWHSTLMHHLVDEQ